MEYERMKRGKRRTKKADTQRKVVTVLLSKFNETEMEGIIL